MEECTLRSCVDRFNNRRYLSAQAYMNAKNVMSNAHVSPHLLANSNNTNIQVSAATSNMPNQIGFAASGVGTIGNSNGVNSNGKAHLNFLFILKIKIQISLYLSLSQKVSPIIVGSHKSAMQMVKVNRMNSVNHTIVIV